MDSYSTPINYEAGALSLHDVISPNAPRHLEVRNAIEKHRAGDRRPLAFRGDV